MQHSGESSFQPERAVEVVGMLGESIVSVNHIESIDRAPSKRPAHALLIAGAVLLLASIFAFIKGVAAASANKAALEAFRANVDVPLHHFRPPHTLGIAYDYLAFGGLVGGLLALGFGLALLRRNRPSSTFTVGNGVGVDYATDDLGRASFSLVETSDAGTTINLTEEMSGQLNQGGVSLTLEHLGTSSLVRPSPVPGVYQLPLPLDASARVDTGRSHFLIRSVPAERSRLDGFLSSVDRRAASFFAGSAVAHLALVALLGTIPPDPRALALDFGSNEGRLVASTSKANEDEKPEPGEKGLSDAKDGEGTSFAGAAGKMGTPDSKVASARRTVKNRGENKHLARATAIRNAREAGVAGALRASNAFVDIRSAADFSSGFDDYDNVGGLDGEPGAQNGGFGNGRWGNGPGTGWGVIYSGNYATIPGGPGGRGPGWSSGPGGKNLRRHKPTGPSVKARVETEGDLDRSIVRRYLRRRRARFQYCYERELTVQPGLRGTMKVTFVIGSNGAVLSARAHGMSNPQMQGCVAGTVQAIKFPAVSAGTVKVNYALHYAPAGG